MQVATYPNEVVTESEHTGRASSNKGMAHMLWTTAKMGSHSPTKYLSSILYIVQKVVV
jgi:hypothetical protein